MTPRPPSVPSSASSRARRGHLALALAALALTPTARSAFAQSVAAAGARTGYELELHGTAAAYAGHAMSLRGVAYEVTGLAQLHALGRARVTVHEILRGVVTGQPLAVTTADAQGRFDVAVAPVGYVALEIAPPTGGTGRTFTFSAQQLSPRRLDLLTDRVLYEPGETVHVWTRLLDAASAAPLANVPLELQVAAGGRTGRLGSARVDTSRAGVASLDVAIPAGAPDGAMTVLADARDAWGTRATVTVRVGRRTVERLMATAHVDQRVVAPGARITGTVSVRSPSGSPVRGARVEVRVAPGAAPVVLATDAHGDAVFATSAPAYLARAIETQTLEVRALHPAYGAAAALASYVLARAPWAVEAVAGASGLVPEVATPVYLTLADPEGQPPPANTAVVVTGPGLAGGSARATTDSHGVVALDFTLPRGAASRFATGTCAGQVATAFDVAVETRVPVTARLCLPVAVDARVLPRVARAVLAPGASVEVAIERAPSERGHAVAVELIYDDPALGRPSVLATTVAAPSVTHVSIALPAGYIGVARVRARPVVAGASAEGTGAQDALIVRPAHAFSLAVTPERAQYAVRERARVRVTTPPGLAGAHLALVARDLAAHGGEQPFALAWLRGQLAAAVASPDTADAERLVRAALAAFEARDATAVTASPLVADPHEEAPWSLHNLGAAQARGDLRDPFVLRDELLRRGVARPMMALERALDAAADAGDFRGILTAGNRAFDPDVLGTLRASRRLDAYSGQTLGGGDATLAMLTAASPEFTFERVAHRVARQRLTRLMAALAGALDPASGGRSVLANEPPDRWLSRLVQRGVVPAGALRDAWGGAFVLRRVAPGRARIVLSVRAADEELVSPGPDRVAGTADDVRDPFERAVPQGSVYAIASGEDALMQRLASLDPGGSVLGQIAQAYNRVSASAGEETRGDVANAQQSESDAPAAAATSTTTPMPVVAQGQSRLRPGRGEADDADRDGVPDAVDAMDEEQSVHASAEAPAATPMPQGAAMRVATREPSPQGARASQLAALVRERFPATLVFVAQAAVDPSGSTPVEFALADALTRYRIEAIVWTDDGWTSSASTEVRVDQDAVVEAPVPPFAVPGDAIRLPLRVSNRSSRVLRVRLAVAAEGGLELDAGAGGEATVAPGDAAEVIVVVTPRRAGHGALVVTATDVATGHALDAARRPLTVLDDARPVRMSADALVDGRATLTLDVPRDAVARADGSLRVTIGEAIFGDPRVWSEEPTDLTWPAWALALGRAPLTQHLAQAMAHKLPDDDAGLDTFARTAGPDALARSIGAAWSTREASDEALGRGLTALTRLLDPSAQADASGVHADALIGLAPALRAAGSRPAIERALRSVVARFRRRVEDETAVSREDDPVRNARAAAALGLTTSGVQGARSARAAEFLRRASRAEVRSEAGIALETDSGRVLDRVGPTALYALARLGQGDRAGAFAVARSLAHDARSVEHWSPEARGLACGLMGTLAAGAAGASPPAGGDTVAVAVDGRTTRALLVGGVAQLTARELSQPGHHTIVVDAPRGTTLIAFAEARYGRPWSASPVSSAALSLALDGPTGARDARAGYRLRVQNRGPRVVSGALVELDLPAGAELDEETRAALRRQLAETPTLTGRTLALRLRALAPGASLRLPLALRWSVGGALHGLGATAWSSTEPGAAASVLAPRVVTIPDVAPEPTAPGRTPTTTARLEPTSASTQVSR